MKDNIILIGFMGCGKTSVGKRLAERLGYRFLDTDESIEERENARITDIFSEKGEACFRRLESALVEELLETAVKSVISTGGGLPLQEENGIGLRKLGFVAYLEVSAETVQERLGDDQSRPLLAGDNRQEKIEKLLLYRQPMYEAAAHLLVSTENKTPEEIAEEIIRNFRIMKKYGTI